MFDLKGIRGCGTIFPYFLPTETQLLEIPLTIPMEFEFQFKNIDIDKSLKMVNSKSQTIIKLGGIINAVFHPEQELSANDVWEKYYREFINLIKKNIDNGDNTVTTYEELVKIWKQRRDGNELYISDPINPSMKTKKDSENPYKFDIKYF
jgi:hypothetical protein